MVGAGDTTTRDRPAPWLIPAVLLVAYAVVQARYLRPPMTEDAMTYFERAAAFPDVPADHWSYRIGLLVPMRGIQLLLGRSEAAYYVLPFVSGPALVLATYWIGKRLFNPVVGVGAAVTLMLGGPFLNHASVPLPDHLATALFMGALGLVLVVAQRAEPRSQDDLLLAAAGLLLGWAYLAREFIPLAYAAIPVVFACYRVPWRRLLWVALPAAGVLAGEFALSWALHGSPIARFTEAGAHGGQRTTITDSRFDALVRLPRTLRNWDGGWVLAAMTLAVPIAVMRLRPGYRIVGAWFLAFWLPLTLGTGLLVPSFRFFRGDVIRYWMPVLPAVLIGGLALVHDAATGLARRWPWRPAARATVAAVLVAAVVVPLSGVQLGEMEDVGFFRANGATQLDDLREWLNGDGADVDVIWTDSHTARVIPLVARTRFGNRLWQGEVRAFEEEGRFVDPDVIDGGAVVFYPFGYQAGQLRWADIPAELRRIEGQPGWERAFSRTDHTLLIIRFDG